MRRRLSLLAAYVAVTAVMAAPLVNYSALASASYVGDARLTIWTLAWDNHATLLRLPLFNANIYYPAADSLAYNEHLFGLSLFTLPIYAATHNPVLAYNIVWLLSFVLNGVAAHMLIRRYTRRDLAAFAGSLVYTFSFYKMLQAHGHLQQVWTWPLPLSIVCLHRWRDNPSWSRAAAWGATFVLQVLTSWYLAVIAAVVNGAALAWMAFGTRTAWRRRLVQLAAVSVVAAALVWPFARHYRHLDPTDPQQTLQLSADTAAYLVPPHNTWMGQWLVSHGSRAPRWIWGERTLFVGWIAIGLALCGVMAGAATGERRSTVAFYLLLVLVGFLLSLGPFEWRLVRPDWSPYGLLARLPGVGGIRAPARFSLIVLLGASVLAGIGVEAALARLRRAGRVAVVALLALMLSEWYVVAFPNGKPQPFPVPPIYKLAVLRAARAIVSLPDYHARPPWFFATDYPYFSTAHWRPIVNGYGRTDPPGHFRIINHMMAFPGPNNAREMRRLGIDYVVFHADRYGEGAFECVREAKQCGEYDLVGQIGSDYLFKVRPAP